MEHVNFKTFPCNRLDGLTMLYLERQDISNLTPRGLLKLYFDTRKELHQALINKTTEDQDGYQLVLTFES